MDFSTVERALTSLSRRRPPLPPGALEISDRLLELSREARHEAAEGAVEERTEPNNNGGGCVGGIAESAVYVELVLQLIRWEEGGGGGGTCDYGQNGTNGTVRWEPLAVGLLLAADYLENRALELSERSSKEKTNVGEHDADDEDEGTGLGTGGGGVYAEGPRVPETRNARAAAGTAPGSILNGDRAPPSPFAPSPPTAAPMPPPPSSPGPRPHQWNADSPAFDLIAALPSLVEDRVGHDEPRVRSLMARVVGAHARLTTSLADRYCRDDGDGKDADGGVDSELRAAVLSAQSGRRSVHESILRSLRAHLAMNEPSRSENPSAASDGALDDTTGWRALETNLNALAAYVDGCVGRGGGGGVGSYPAEEILLLSARESGSGKNSDDDGRWFMEGLTHCCVVHVNRHVRAASAAVLGTVVKACMRSAFHASEDDDPATRLLTDCNSGLRKTLKDSLKSTLSDNWSQVRMAGSVLCRQYVQSLVRVHRRNEKKRRAKKNRIKDEGNKKGVEGKDESNDLTDFEVAIGPDMVLILLPRMCLNRFYLAQGVKLYSQETWKLVFQGAAGNGAGGGGVGAVARCAAPLCRYYSKMCDADNHAVREAACQGVAELAQKIGRHPSYAEFLSPFVTTLLQALLMCFHDESWPVRDEACLACATFCLAFAEECRPELPVLFDRWTEQLTDQIWSVREDAAVALGDAVAAYGPDMLTKVLSVVRKSLPSARDQLPMSRGEYRKLQNDMAAHTDNQLYSCGSLAPKLRKGGAGRIGCSSCDVTRPKAPWEATDGCVYLLRELCARFYDGGSDAGGRGGGVGGVGVGGCKVSAGERNEGHMKGEDVAATAPSFSDDVLLPLLTELADVSRLSHYPQSDDLRTTLWKQLPAIARAVGKKNFKRSYLDLFMTELSKSLEDRGCGVSQLSVHAAGQCAEDLSGFIGPGVFRGRFEEPWMGEAFDRAMAKRRGERLAVEGPGMGAGRFLGAGSFSPFGPPPGAATVAR